MNELAARYAQALYEVIKDEKQLKEDQKVLMGSDALWQALGNPCVTQKEKHQLINTVLERKTAKEFLRFYHVLCDHNRVPLLGEIIAEYHRIVLREKNFADATIRCAFVPEPEELNRIKEVLCRNHQKAQVFLHVKQDPSLLGGFVIQIDGTTYDKSISGMLRALQNNL